MPRMNFVFNIFDDLYEAQGEVNSLESDIHQMFMASDEDALRDIYNCALTQLAKIYLFNLDRIRNKRW